MIGDHENHLTTLISRIAEEVDRKYRQGQAEHGGRLWEKPGMLRHAIDEAVDQLVYLLTLSDQIEAQNPTLHRILMTSGPETR